MGKPRTPRKSPLKFKDGQAVKYYGNNYTIEYCFHGEQGNWYKLTDRLGLVHETELKED